jgi:hypothetical protein
MIKYECMINSFSEMFLSYISTLQKIPYIAVGLPPYNRNFEPNINNYDTTGLFAIGFYMFLLGFAIVFFVFFLSSYEFNGEPSPLISTNAKRILLSVGVIATILGLIISIVRWITLNKI